MVDPGGSGVRSQGVFGGSGLNERPDRLALVECLPAKRVDWRGNGGSVERRRAVLSRDWPGRVVPLEEEVFRAGPLNLALASC